MAITREYVESVMIRRAKNKMALVDFDIVPSGENDDLDDPIATGLRKMGFSASVPVVDADFATLDSSQVDELLTRVELRLLENIQENLDMVDISVGQRRESLGQLEDKLIKAIERLQTKIANDYGIGTLTCGNLLLNFAQHLDETEVE